MIIPPPQNPSIPRVSLRRNPIQRLTPLTPRVMQHPALHNSYPRRMALPAYQPPPSAPPPTPSEIFLGELPELAPRPLLSSVATSVSTDGRLFPVFAQSRRQLRRRAPLGRSCGGPTTSRGRHPLMTGAATSTRSSSCSILSAVSYSQRWRRRNRMRWGVATWRWRSRLLRGGAAVRLSRMYGEQRAATNRP